jgi:hypothetical protein
MTFLTLKIDKLIDPRLKSLSSIKKIPSLSKSDISQNLAKKERYKLRACEEKKRLTS